VTIHPAPDAPAAGPAAPGTQTVPGAQPPVAGPASGLPVAAAVPAPEAAGGPAAPRPTTTTTAPGVAVAPPSSPAALLRAGAENGLLPFAAPTTSAGPSALPLVVGGPGSVAAAAASRPGFAPDGTPVREPTSGGSGGGRTPHPPSGPPGSAGAGGVAAAFGGAAGGMWCAILLSFVFFATADLRRYRCRLVLACPAGIAFPLRRPG